MSNKIPKKVAHQLTKKAEALPKLQQSSTNGRPLFKRTRIGGAELLRQFPNGTDEFGNPFVAQQWYWRDMPVYVNHEVALRHIFVTGGMEAVDKYCTDARDLLEQAIKPRTRFGALLVYLKLKLMKPFLRWKHPLEEQAELLTGKQ